MTTASDEEDEGSPLLGLALVGGAGYGVYRWRGRNKGAAEGDA